MYQFNYLNGHLIADIDGKQCLIDTGSPKSIGAGVVKINNKIHTLTESYFAGIDLATIANHVGTHLDALIGTDILRVHEGLFVWNDKAELHFSLRMQDYGTPFDFTGGVPIIEVIIEGKLIRACIDTGATHSYISSDIAMSGKPSEEIYDFYPTVGNFTTNTVILSVQEADSVAAEEFKFAILREPLNQLLKSVSCDGILGLDWLRNKKSHFQLNFRDNVFTNY